MPCALGIQVSLCSSDKPDNDQVLRMVFGVPAKDVFHFKGAMILVNGWDVDAVDSAIKHLREEIKSEEVLTGLRPIFSLDIEYPDKGDRSVALIQVGNSKFAVLIRVRAGVVKCKELPSSLLKLLNDESIDKVDDAT